MPCYKSDRGPLLGCLSRPVFLFPLNLLIIFIEVLTEAYMLCCFARIWSQTFKDEDYKWKEVFREV